MPNMMYPRLVQIVRAGMQKTLDDGLHQGEVVIASNLDANIEIASSRSAPPAVTPGATNTNDSTPHWLIYFPVGALDAGVLKKGDKVSDDIGRTFQIEAEFPHMLGVTAAARNYHP